MKRILKCCLCFIFLPFLAFSQDYGGEDKFTCSGGTTNIGTPTPCQECCYKWYPTTGLDNPNSSNPKVSGLTESTIYSVTVSLPSGDYVEDFVTVYVYSMQLSIFKPLFMTGGSEVMVPDAIKKTIGAQTMVNIDNDDCDDKFDNTDNSVVGGDDEFIKIRVTMNVDLPGFAANNAENRSPLQYVAKVFLAGNSTATGVKFWKSANKSAGEFFLGSSELNLEAAGATSYQGFIWAEGTDGHNTQRQTQLKAKASSDNTPLCMDEDIVSLTVLAVKSIEWEGIENGYTGNGKNNSNTLDDSPIASGAPNKRVFPEKKYISGTTLTNVKDIVKLKVTLSTTPIEEIKIYLRPFDIDDPSVETAFVDPNDLGTSSSYAGSAGLTYNIDDDNRGGVNYTFASTLNVTTKYGHFISSGVFPTSPTSGIYSISINSISFSTDYKISKYPGDNFRVAAYSDLDFMKNLRNIDQYDQHKIVDKCTGVNSGCKEIEMIYMSPILTSFRTLHIEVDGMKRAEVVSDNQNQDIRQAFITNFDSPTTNSGEVQILSGLVDVSGGSDVTITNNLIGETNINLGRFQGGLVKIGNLNFKINATLLPKIELSKIGTNPNVWPSFGGLIVTLKKGSNILNVTVQKIVKLSNGEFEVYIPTTPTLPDYVGGTAGIVGGSAPIILLPNSNTNYLRVFKLASIRMPVKVVDDDNINLLPFDLLSEPNAQSILKSDFMESYIDPVLDGGGNLSFNNSEQIEFLKNLPTGTATSTLNTYYEVFSQSKEMETPVNLETYWVSYVVIGWQPRLYEDFDPYIEGASPGLTPYYSNTVNCNDVSGSLDMSFLSIETIRDNNTTSGITRIGKITSHEIGHQLGLTHFLKDDDFPSQGCVECTTQPIICQEAEAKIMYWKFNVNLDYAFCNQHVNHLRSRKFSPKR
jgi:hypothetical protein